jgi:hypothetical protein
MLRNFPFVNNKLERLFLFLILIYYSRVNLKIKFVFQGNKLELFVKPKMNMVLNNTFNFKLFMAKVYHSSLITFDNWPSSDPYSRFLC